MIYVCTQREARAHQLLYDALTPASALASRLGPEDPLRLTEEFGRHALYRALELDHPGLMLLNRTEGGAWRARPDVSCWYTTCEGVQRPAYEDPEGGVAPRRCDGPAVATLVDLWLDLLEIYYELNAREVERLAGEAARKAALFEGAATACVGEARAACEEHAQDLRQVASGHTASAQRVRRGAAHWRAQWDAAPQEPNDAGGNACPTRPQPTA